MGRNKVVIWNKLENSYSVKMKTKIPTTPGARKAVTLLYGDKSVCRKSVILFRQNMSTSFFILSGQPATRMHLPEVLVHKGGPAGWQSPPVSSNSGIGHEDRVDLKASALEAGRRGGKHL